jgi:hypothetical protein
MKAILKGGIRDGLVIDETGGLSRIGVPFVRYQEKVIPIRAEDPKPTVKIEVEWYAKTDETEEGATIYRAA